ncbi:hypothetical protein Tco_1556026 [Tanacetum coccineum]
MDDPNLTIEEYIILEEEKARKHGKVLNWQTATYGKIRVDDDLHDLSSVETEFPTIVVNNDFATHDAFSCKSKVSAIVNEEIDFRISFDESDNGDYTIIYDANSFSYKMIYDNDLKTDSENDYEKVMPSIPSLEPAISCFDDLDFFNDFKNEFRAIVYNDAQNMEPLPPHEQRHHFLRYKGLEYSDSDIANFESRLERIHMREVHRVPIFDFGGLPDLMSEGLTARLTMKHRDEAGVSVFTSQVWRRMLDIRGPLLGGARRRISWSEFNVALRLHTEEEIQTPGFGHCWEESGTLKKVTVTDLFYLRGMDVGSINVPYLLARYLRLFAVGRKSGAHISVEAEIVRLWPSDYILRRRYRLLGDFLGTAPSYTLIWDPILRLCHQLIECSIARRSQAPEKVTVTDLFYLRGMDVGSINVPYLLARYLRLFAAERKSGAHISGGQFVARLANHFRLLTIEILGRLTIIAPELSVIDMAKMRQPDATAGAPAEVDDVPVVNEGVQADPIPAQAPQQPPLPPPAPARTMPQSMAKLEGDIQEIRGELTEQRESRSYIHAKFSDPCSILEASQMQDWRGQQLSRTLSSLTPDLLYLLIKPVSKFNNIVHTTEPSRIFTTDMISYERSEDGSSCDFLGPLRILFEQRIATMMGYRGGSGGCVEMKGYAPLFIYEWSLGGQGDLETLLGHVWKLEGDVVKLHKESLGLEVVGLQGGSGFGTCGGRG